MTCIDAFFRDEVPVFAERVVELELHGFRLVTV